MRHRNILLALAFFMAPWMAHAGLFGPGQIDPDEDVLFYPTFGWLNDSGTTWTVELHACVFEPEANSLWRKALIHEIAEATGVDDLTTAQTQTFNRRLRLFLVDHKRNQRIRLSLAGRELALEPSAANGHAYLAAHIPAAEQTGTTGPTWIVCRAILPRGQARAFEGNVQLIAPTGLSVISDIDDTIKETGVLDRKRMLANTFWQPQAPVGGMAQLYRGLAGRGAAFHYVSGSPWQLYEPLRDFIAAQGFPAGSFHLRHFRLKDGSVIKFLRNDISAFKTEEIERILGRFPRRQFILIGDSGERDPEIYADIARKYPDRIAAIFIRKVKGSDLSQERFDRAANGLPKDKLIVFSDPAQCLRMTKTAP